MVRDDGKEHFKIFVGFQVVGFFGINQIVDHCTGICAIIGLDQE